jgi:hypothetical protein
VYDKYGEIIKMSINSDSHYERMKKERNKISDATMPPPTETKQTGYRTKHSVITTLPMHLGTLEKVDCSTIGIASVLFSL